MAALNSTLYTGQVAGKLPKPGPGIAMRREVQAIVAIPATGTGTALNDTIGLFVLPKNARLLGFRLQTDRLDTNGSPLLTLDVGYTASTQAWVAAWAGASAAVTALSPNSVTPVIGALGYQPTVDTPIFVTVHAAAATKAAGTLVANMTFDFPGVAS